MFSKLTALFRGPVPPSPSPESKEEKTVDKKQNEKKEEKSVEEKKVEDKGQEKKEEKREEENKEKKKEENDEAKPASSPTPEQPKAEVKPADLPNTEAGAAEGEAEQVPPPIVFNSLVDERLRDLAKRLRERTDIYKEKVIDPYASSPERSPPVTPVLRRCDWLKKQEEERIRKEEEEKRKKEEEVKKAAEKKEEKKDDKKKEEKKEEVAEPKPEEKSIFPKISFTFIDVMLKPLEDKMDTVLGTTIDPFTDRRYIKWLSVVTVAFNYNVWLATARLCFPYHTPQAIPFWILCDVLCDLINILDIVIFQPRLQFVKAGDIVKDRVQTKKHYRTSARFQSDILSIIPFDLLSLQFGFTSFFRFNRFIRYESFFEFSDRLESIMAKAYIWRVGRTTGYLLYCLHLNACLYYVASAYEGLGTTEWVYDGEGNAYLRCYYFATRTLITIGGLPEPHTVFEIVFQMVNFFVGVFVFSSLIGQMRDVIGAATAGQTYFRASMDSCVAYMNTYRIPRQVQNRVRTWYNYTWDSQGMLDESELLEQMPLVMRTAIAVDINLATFQKIDLFKGCDNQMLVDMLLRLKSIVYLPGDFVVKKGDIGKEMYIIKAGEVQVVGGPDNTIVFVTLKAGCVFGEISLLQSSANGGNRRTANVAAHGFANLFVLEKRDLFDILVHYPESQKVLARKGKKLMKAKGPAAAKADEEKKRGLALFGTKPPTPKMARIFGGFGKGGLLEKLKAAAAEEK
ncbi:cyclic nucleotide-gated cation channel beta-3 isoform X2 [Denticeps clupeoides]|uniref:cyclic nucleotide-gated cation channel beta-3 isoform X2 n=1 Tax=Denticeps clupeoides TaxID=299321 RepID=UPI0010A2C641|nr:cyclic nucleotide-gated cation channel beta-3-like isoform X2 [Denticeps clupeoides]